HPSQLVWKDRRPIGALFLSSTVPHVPANPRGWFGNRADIDTTTDEGRAAFKTALMRYADTSIAEMKLADAQGMITWDPEGQEHPHATSYLGDPRNLPPEMDPIIDEYFRKFTDAKLRVGVCVRPQRAGVSFYGAHASQVDIPPWDQFDWLNDKIAYAKKRWGCSIFYIDSNVDRQHGEYSCSDPAVFRRLAAANPDVLLMPEHECAAYWSFSAPYNELRQNWTATPALARALYPDSFSIIYVADGAIEKRHDELVRSVRAGDILLFRGWWDDPDNQQVRAIYQEAKQGSKPVP
nr:hypothetical protein [Planctomycetota bacterium]